MQIRKKILGENLKLPNCKYVLIDTDAGGDDCQAIILAINEAKRTGKVIVGITCVDGNAYVKDVAINVAISVSLCQADIPIYLGSQMSIMGPTHKDFYFSSDGLGLKQQDYVKKLKSEGRYRNDLIQKTSGVDFIVQCANKYQNDLAIIALGPLTNLALAYHYDNSIAQKVSMISLMGASISALGIRQFFAAQFNFFLDAQAAKIVIAVFPKIVISSFDLSCELGTGNTIHLFKEQERQKARFIHNIHEVILSTHRPGVCDPLACIPVFSPEDVVAYYQNYAEVETKGLRTKGLLIFDWFKEHIEGKNKIIAIQSINLPSFIQRISDSYN